MLAKYGIGYRRAYHARNYQEYLSELLLKAKYGHRDTV